MSSKKTNRSARGLVEAVEENGMPKVCRKYDRVDFSGLLRFHRKRRRYKAPAMGRKQNRSGKLKKRTKKELI